MKWNSQMPTEATDDRDHRVAVAEDREERAQRRLDQHPVGDVADAAADPVAEGRQEARIVAEAGLGVGEDAGVEIGLALGQRLEDARQHVHAGAGDHPGDDRAERPGRAARSVRGSEKMPAPTIEPTTIAVNAKSESFCVVSDAIAPSSVPAYGRAMVQIRFIRSASRA